jgi:hemerythrin
MKLTHCVNGFVDRDEDLPSYGQLGCNGFVVLDKDHHVVSPQTSAFMDVRSLAFKHVEALLTAMIAGAPLPKVCPGEYVRLQKPEREEQAALEGEPGVCTGLTEDGSALHIQLLGRRTRGQKIQAPPSAVRKINPDGSELKASGCGSSVGCDTTGSCGVGCGTGGGGCESSEGGAGCDGGGCSKAGCESSVDEAFLQKTLGQLVSVKVEEMDDEHRECASCLYQLAVSRTVAALRAAAACLEEHFAHEEALFDEYGFGEHKNEKLSAKKTHIEDHRRILEKFRQAYAEGQKGQQGWRVPVPWVKEVLQDFHEHTTRYDVQYADVLGDAAGKRPSGQPIGAQPL